MNEHQHHWFENMMLFKFCCECGATVTHDDAFKVAELSGKTALSPAILNQLAKATEITAS